MDLCCFFLAANITKGRENCFGPVCILAFFQWRWPPRRFTFIKLLRLVEPRDLSGKEKINLPSHVGRGGRKGRVPGAGRSFGSFSQREAVLDRVFWTVFFVTGFFGTGFFVTGFFVQTGFFGENTT